MRSFIFGLCLALPSVASAKTFEQYCRRDKNDKEIQLTVKTVLMFYKTNDCREPQKLIDQGEDRLKITSPFVRNIAPIAGLKGLKRLTLVRNRVADLSPFEGYEGLERIYLVSNPITSIAPLFTIKSLRALTLDETHVRSLAGIENLQNLFDLQIYDSPIQDHTPIGALTNLERLAVGRDRHHSADWPCRPNLSPATGVAEAVAKLTKLESFSASGVGLKRIDFLPKQARLLTLDVSCNQIEDIASLARFSEISTLALSFNPLKSIAALKSLPELANLGLAATGIDSLAVLSEHKELLDVAISHNSITDLGPLAHSPRLNILRAANNAITDISALAKVSSLYKLTLSGNPVAKLPDMSAINRIQYLFLDGTAIISIEPLKAMTSTSYIKLQNIGALKAEELNHLADSNIRTLDISENDVDDLSAVTLPSLKLLIADNNNLQDVAKLGNFPQLGLLSIADNPIAELAGVCERFSKLGSVSVAATSVTSVASLKDCKELSSLDVSHSPFRDFDQLGALTDSWHRLELAGLELTDISFLAQLSMDSLDISDNAISDLTPLTNIGGMRSFKAKNNRITSVKPLAKKSGIRYSRDLDVSGNPLGTTTKKNAENCPPDAMSSAVALWCSRP